MKKRILVVDDEYTIRELIDIALEPDYEVLKAEDGEDALKKVKAQKPDLIILDIMMPKLDGFEVCRRLRQDSDTKGIPVIILTAKHMAEDLREAILADADEFITKPFEPELLKSRVDAYLSEDASRAKIDRKLFQHGKAMHYIKGRE